jgi:hypothetical protein
MSNVLNICLLIQDLLDHKYILQAVKQSLELVASWTALATIYHLFVPIHVLVVKIDWMHDKILIPDASLYVSMFNMFFPGTSL